MDDQNKNPDLQQSQNPQTIVSPNENPQLQSNASVIQPPSLPTVSTQPGLDSSQSLLKDKPVKNRRPLKILGIILAVVLIVGAGGFILANKLSKHSTKQSNLSQSSSTNIDSSDNHSGSFTAHLVYVNACTATLTLDNLSGKQIYTVPWPSNPDLSATPNACNSPLINGAFGLQLPYSPDGDIAWNNNIVTPSGQTLATKDQLNTEDTDGTTSYQLINSNSYVIENCNTQTVTTGSGLGIQSYNAPSNCNLSIKYLNPSKTVSLLNINYPKYNQNTVNSINFASSDAITTNQGLYMLGLSSDGQTLYFTTVKSSNFYSGNPSGVYGYNLTTRKSVFLDSIAQPPLPQNSGDQSTPIVLSPDGKWLAVFNENSNNSLITVALYNLTDKGKSTQIKIPVTTNEYFNGFIGWSPDDKKILLQPGLKYSPCSSAYCYLDVSSGKILPITTAPLQPNQELGEIYWADSNDVVYDVDTYLHSSPYNGTAVYSGYSSSNEYELNLSSEKSTEIPNTPTGSDLEDVIYY